MLPRLRFRAALWAPLLVVACTRPQPEPPSVEPDVLARWDGGEVRSADFDEYLLSLPPAQRWPAPTADAAAWRNDRLDEIFQQRVLDDLAASGELDDDERFASLWELQRRGALAQAFFEREAGNLEVTEDEAREYFSRFGHEFDKPETRILSNILLSFPPDADEAARDAVCAQAETLRGDIEDGAAFESAARRYSSSSSAANGGLIGAVRRDQLRGEARDVVFGLETGQVSRVLRTPAGCQLFLVRQVAPAYEARFEGVFTEIMARLREARKTAEYIKLYRAELTTLGIEPPRWDEAAGVEAFSAETTHFALGDRRVTGLDLLQRIRTGVPPAQALPQLASELVLSVAMERSAPEGAVLRAAMARKQFTRQYLRQRAAERQMEALPEDVLRPYFEANASRFVSEPAVELTLVSWPIGAGDPLRWTTRPRAFAAGVATAQGRVEDVWPAFADDEGVQRRSIPLVPLRALAEREPHLAAQLLGDLTDGQVVGPYAAGRRLEVIVVDSYLPTRALGFVEAIDRVRADYAQNNAPTLARQRLDELERQRGFRRFDEHLEALGARLLEELLQPGGETTTDG